MKNSDLSLNLKIIMLFFVLVFYVVPSFADQHDAKHVLILGDSLSAGYGLKQDDSWVNLLQNKYINNKQNVKLINASISGETSGGALRRLDGILDRQKVDFALIELGANDGLRGYPVKKMRTNLIKLIEKLQTANVQVALMQIKITPNYGPRYNKLFSESYPIIADQTDVRLVPFFMEEIALRPELMQNDLLHPNKIAQPIIVEIMKKEFDNWLKIK